MYPEPVITLLGERRLAGIKTTYYNIIICFVKQKMKTGGFHYAWLSKWIDNTHFDILS